MSFVAVVELNAEQIRHLEDNEKAVIDAQLALSKAESTRRRYHEQIRKSKPGTWKPEIQFYEQRFALLFSPEIK